VTVLGHIPGRLFRISFSGELAYELAVPAGFGEAVASAIMHAGQPHGILPYGLEALSSMRVEKGFITHNEINGRHTAGDVGLGRMASKKKDYIGRMMSEREGLNDPDRMQLVGVRPLDPAKRFRAGSHLLKVNDKPSTKNDQGYVSSAAWSPTLDSWIGLGMLKRGRERPRRAHHAVGRPARCPYRGGGVQPRVHRSGRGEDPCLTSPLPFLRWRT
jgi:glycine cleavage system aminomethyltransferase T